MEDPYIKSDELDLYTIPSKSSWFSWADIHDIERTHLREFFDGTSITRSPKIYKEYRDFFISKYRECPSRRLTFTEARKSLVGDVSLLRKVFLFLDEHGLINFGAEEEEEKEPWKVKVDEGPPAGVRVVGVPNGRATVLTVPPSGRGYGSKFPPLRSYKDVYGDTKECLCRCCKQPAGSDYYECGKDGGFRVCVKCLKSGNYGKGYSIDDFKLINCTSNIENYSSLWTEAETLLLLESVLKHGDDWELIAENVKTKNKADCILKMIQLPFGDLMLGAGYVKDMLQKIDSSTPSEKLASSEPNPPKRMKMEGQSPNVGNESKENGNVENENRHGENVEIENKHAGNVEIENKHDGNVEIDNKHDQNVEMENKHAGNVEIENKHDGNVEIENKHDQNGEMENKHAGNVEIENKHDGNVEIENKHDGNVEMENKHAGNVEIENKHDGNVEIENKHDGNVEMENNHDGNAETESKDDGNAETEKILNGIAETESKQNGNTETKNKQNGNAEAASKQNGVTETEDKQDGYTVNQAPHLKRKTTTPALDTGSSLLKQVSLLSSVVDPRITASAAEAVISALCDEIQCPRDIFDGNDTKDEDLEFRLQENRVPQADGMDVDERPTASESQGTSCEKNALPLSLQMRAAIPTALGAVAARAKLLADQEEREIETLVAHVIEAQMKKVQHKSKHFDDLEMMMEKEYNELEDLKESIIMERMDVLNTIYRSRTSGSRDPKSEKA